MKSSLLLGLTGMALAQAAPTDADVTHKVTFNVKVGNEEPSALTLNLFGEGNHMRKTL
jgi:hypothetical protein